MARFALCWDELLHRGGIAEGRGELLHRRGAEGAEKKQLQLLVCPAPPHGVHMKWTRVDVPGTDTCELLQTGGGWLLEGVAEYQAGEGRARLEYRAECDERWVTLRGEVRGEVAGKAASMAIVRERSGEWVVNGAPVPELRGLLDLDLGFTPATNLLPLRRLALEVGESADAEAAWVDEERWTMHRLPQRYERRDETHYWYASPTAGYSGMLTVGRDGFVEEYPGLWTRGR